MCIVASSAPLFMWKLSFCEIVNDQNHLFGLGPKPIAPKPFVSMLKLTQTNKFKLWSTFLYQNVVLDLKFVLFAFLLSRQTKQIRLFVFWENLRRATWFYLSFSLFGPKLHNCNHDTLLITNLRFMGYTMSVRLYFVLLGRAEKRIWSF